MTEQDYELFASLAPLQTRVKGALDMVIVREWGNFSIFHQEGVIVRHGYEFERTRRSAHGKGTTWHDAPVVTFFTNPHEWDIQPAYLLYWVNGEWITFYDLMKPAK